MKEYVIFLLSALSVVAGCTMEEDFVKEEQNNQTNGKKITIQAIREDDPETRTVLESDGSVWWTPGDAISLFYGSGTNGGSKFTSNSTDTSKVTNFTGVITAITGGGEISVDKTYFWGVYPYSDDVSCDGTSVTLTVPSQQTAVPGTFATNTFPTVGRSQGLIMGFYNICGGWWFTVTSEGINKVTLKSKNGEAVTGKVKVGFDASGIPEIREVIDGSDEVVLECPAGEYFEVGKKYYIILLPDTFGDGFTMTLETDTGTGVYDRTASTTIKRSKFSGFDNLDNYCTFSPNPNVIYYTSTDGEIVTPSKTNAFGAKIDSNTYENGQGIMIFNGDVTSIGDQAFRSCRSLASIDIPISVKSIGNDAFSDCSSLESIIIPEGVTTIGYTAFGWCSGLTSVTIPNSIRSVGRQAFQGCSSLTAFNGYHASSDGRCLILNQELVAFAPSGLTSYSIPEGITSIGNIVFYQCTNLTSIVIPESVISIGYSAFSSCNLSSVIIPSRVSSIGDFAFSVNENLATVTVLATTPPSLLSIYSDAKDPFTGCPCVIYVPIESYHWYQSASDWNKYLNQLRPIIPEEPTRYYYGGWYLSAKEGDTISFDYYVGDDNDGENCFSIYVGDELVYDDPDHFSSCSGSFSYTFEKGFTGWIHLDWGWSCSLRNVTSTATVLGRGEVYPDCDLSFNDFWLSQPSYLFEYVDHTLTVNY